LLLSKLVRVAKTVGSCCWREAKATNYSIQPPEEKRTIRETFGAFLASFIQKLILRLVALNESTNAHEGNILIEV
jgi:hypothetical protein